MLPVSLHEVTFRRPNGFALAGLTFTFAPSTHTAIAATPGAGATTLLRLIGGDLTPDSGDVVFGDRIVNRMRRAKRPVLLVDHRVEVPGRWAVDHALVAALRDRSLDRIDRQREFQLVVAKWNLEPFLRRRVDALSSSEQTLVHVARIELMRPAILLADRILAPLSPALRPEIADQLFRSLRVIGTTVISVISDPSELAFSNTVLVLDGGRIVQSGSAAEVYGSAVDERAASATGRVNAIPVTVRHGQVESPIGSWSLAVAPFEGTGLALLRPEDFEVARAGEDSDFVFSIEEAGFSEGRWHARGLLSGGIVLHVELPNSIEIRKGRLLALRFDPSRVTLVARSLEMPRMSVPIDAIPSRRDSR